MYASAHNWTQTASKVRASARRKSMLLRLILVNVMPGLRFGGCIYWYRYMLYKRKVIGATILRKGEYKCKLGAWWKQGARKWKQTKANESRWKQLSACVRARMKASLRMGGWWTVGIRQNSSRFCSITRTSSKRWFCIYYRKDYSIVLGRYYNI